jgi:hypothetical protein
LFLSAVFLAAGEGHDLGGEIGVEFLPARRALDLDVAPRLSIEEADELEGHRIGALMEELVERVLTVRARLAEDDGPGGVGELDAFAVDSLAVGLHVELLKVGGEAREGLGVGQDGRLRPS